MLYAEHWDSWRLTNKKIHLPMLKMQVWSLGLEGPLEKEVATQSSFLAWETPWTEEPGGLLPMWH